MPATETALDRAIDKAKTAAVQHGETRYVASVDHNEDRKTIVCTERYVNSDEFFAFDGEVLAIADANGNVVIY